MQYVSRRNFIKLGFCTAAALAMPQMALSAEGARSISLYNLHTGEAVKKIAYCENGKYINGAMVELNHLLRDFRTGDIHTIDKNLFDQLYTLQKLTEAQGGFQVISGYRSPKTNAMLREASGGVAKHSMHLEGRAIDIRLPGKDLAYLHKAARSMNAGGVGYYPKSDFVHIDTGKVRHWG